MAVYVKNLVIDAGSTFSEILEITQPTKDPVNLTGFSANCYMRKTAESSSYVGFGVSFVDRPLGLIQISMASTVTSNLKSGRYVYDLVVTLPRGKKKVVVEGNVLVRGGISTGCF